MLTKVIRSLVNLKPEDKGGVVTIGNFDGIHLGHKALITELKAKAQALNTFSMVITFEPHPFEFFAQDKLTIPRLTRFREKYLQLHHLGIDKMLVLSFNQRLATITASDFLTIVGTHLAPKHLLIGDDFRFGYQRQGDIHLLRTKASHFGYSVQSMPTFMLENERVSSTRVRQALAKGDHQLANKLLGRPYSMVGRVRAGDQLGRQWGFPTANLFLHRKLTPVHGIYTVYMHGIDKNPWPGVANVGIRPTVNGTRTLLEVHLLDFNREIYGQYVEVEFCQKLREEIRFPSIELLRDQIAKDVEMARSYFKLD